MSLDGRTYSYAKHCLFTQPYCYSVIKQQQMNYIYPLPDKDRAFAVHLRKIVVIDVEFREEDLILVTGHCSLERRVIDKIIPLSPNIHK